MKIDEKNLEILSHLCAGKTQKEIAALLSTTPKTIELRLAKMRHDNSCSSTYQLIAQFKDGKLAA